MKTLILFRGLPGSGKTTLAQKLCEAVHCADDYFDRFNDGVFNPDLLESAHNYCESSVTYSMEAGCNTIGVANTFTRTWEMQSYKDLADQFGYRVHQVIVENNHGSKSVHDVPENTIAKMKNRFEVKL